MSKIKFAGVEIPQINKQARRNVILYLDDEYFYAVLNTKSDKDTDAVQGNIAIFDSEGNPVDSGVNIIGTTTFQSVVNDGSEISGLTSYAKGQYWVVGTAGTYVGQVCEAGDFIFCISDFDSAYSATDFEVVQHNIDMAVINGKADKIIYVDASTTPASMDPNKVYQFGTLSGNTTFPALSPVAVGDTEAKIWYWTFTTPATAPTITWPVAITGWAGGEAPEIEASKYYEVTVMNGIGTILSA